MSKAYPLSEEADRDGDRDRTPYWKTAVND